MARRIALICLILIAIVDGLIAYLAVLFSELVFGRHEGFHGEPGVVAGWLISLIACVAAPIAGFILWAYRRAGVGILVAVLPIAGALLLLAS